MVQLIVGNKGKGKTKVLLDKVNTEIQEVAGNIVYLDKSTKHMYELNNKIRLIDVSEYMIENVDAFTGFVCGIISQDHDLQKMYLDNFMVLSNITVAELEAAVSKFENVSKKFNVDFVMSVSVDVSEISEALKEKVIVAL